MKFKLKTLRLADPVPLDVLEVRESFLIPLLDLKMEVAELFTVSKSYEHYNKMEQVLTVHRREKLHKDARLHLLS